MTAHLQWDVIPHTLNTPVGSVVFNVEAALGSAADGGYLLLDRTACRMGAAARATVEDVPQSDGGIVHPVFVGGYRVTIVVELLKEKISTDPACGALLVQLLDSIMANLNSLRDAGGGRLLWTPTDHDQRMVDDLWLVGEADVSWDGPIPKLSFELATPLPYAMVAAEVTTSIDDGASAVLNNTGSAKFWPVVKAYGPSAGFTIRNETTGRELVYDSALPGANTLASGHYIEFDFFRNTAFLDGDVALRMAGVDASASDFWPLAIGSNTVSVDGADIDVLWQPAFA